MSRSALITGITGQDGQLPRRASAVARLRGARAGPRAEQSPCRRRPAHRPGTLHLVEGDLHDQSSLISVLEATHPDEVYNLAAISFVALSFKQAINTGEITGLGVTRMLDAIRVVNPAIRFYQASSQRDVRQGA